MATQTDEKISAAPSRPVSTDQEIGELKRITTAKDIGAALFLEVQACDQNELRAEWAAVRRKIDWRVLPLICVTYTIQFLDKLSLNYANAYGLQADLGFTGQNYSWVASSFNFGYLFWALPANLLIQRIPVAKYTGGMILTWCVLLLCHLAVQNFAGMMVIRFLLGMFEAGISPAIMNIVALFYTRSEQPLRMCLFLGFNGLATMLGALLAFGLGHVESGALASWRLIFMTIGLMNFVWGWVFLWFMPDSPASAKFLSHREKLVAIHRVSENMVGVKSSKFAFPQAVEALLDIKVICIAICGLACGIINGGVSNFASSLIKGFGFSGIYATLLQLPTGAFELVLVPLVGLAAGYWKDTRCLFLILICLPPLGGLLSIRLTGLDHRWTLVGCTWLQYLIGGPVILCWNLLNTNIAGHTKRSFSNAMWFICYAGGNIGGANIFFTKEAPRYFSALTGLITCYAGMIAIGAFLWAYLKAQNNKRDKIYGSGERTEEGADEQAILDGFADQTDKESVHFRYGM